MSNKKTCRVGFFTLLGLLFIGLKLGNVITWSWWWVTLPIWGETAILLIFLLIVLFVEILSVIINRK